jgi:hypothetical protein
MKTLTKETARSLAMVLNSRLSTCYSDDLVAIIGVGRESNNEGAIQSWLLSRFSDTDIACSERLMEHASEGLIQHLNDLRMDVAIGLMANLASPPIFVQLKTLNDRELRCIARAIYLLVLGEDTKPYLDSLVELVLSGEGNAIDRIVSWISLQETGYNYYPSELTLPLAQRLMKILKRVGESY